MIKDKSTYLGVLFLFLSTLPVSCTEDEHHELLKIENVEDLAETNNHSTDYSDKGNQEEEENLNGEFDFSLYAKNSYSNQSAAAYNDYLFLVPIYRGKIYMYSLKEKLPLSSFSMKAMTELNSSGGDVYHCNQTSFGADYYDANDPFPLLYISQRARSDKRCFTEVFRIIANKSDTDTLYTSFELQLVQVIYFPPMSESNSLGNVNTVIDRENHLLYTYSRNNRKEDANYRQCKISCFAIPDVHQSEVYLEDSDIKSSFMLDISAYYMQGACIVGKYLCIARGAASVKYIDLNIVDLKTQQMKKQLDLLGKGYRWEPEGCFYYKGHLMIATGKNIWELDFDH